MMAMAGGIGSLPVWDLTWGQAAVLGALAISALQYGGTAGVLASAGKNGRLRHVRAELVGALRGALAITVLVGPVIAVAAIDALASDARFAVYMDAATVLAVAYFPFTVISGVSFAMARSISWKIRSNINSMVLATLMFLRPYMAMAGVVAAVIVTHDAGVTLVGFVGVAAGLQSTRLVRRWWYSRPVRLEDLGVA